MGHRLAGQENHAARMEHEAVSGRRPGARRPRAVGRRKTTLEDVAALVGVSTRTVSRVVNGESGYSDATRSRVERAIQQLGYRPNRLARSLVRGRTETFGLVVTYLSDPFFSEIADGVQEAALASGHRVFLAGTSDLPERQAGILDALAEHGADGVIIFPVPGTGDELGERATEDFPVVVLDEPATGENMASVCSQIAAGAEAATSHLLGRCAGRVGMVGSAASLQRRREEGFRTALQRCADPGRAGAVERDDPTVEGGRRAAERLLAAQPDIGGILAYNDLMAVGAMEALSAGGRSIPDDVALVGFDDVLLSRHVSPPLTTVRIDRPLVGRRAVELLVALIGGERPASINVPVSLQVRASA